MCVGDNSLSGEGQGLLATILVPKRENTFPHHTGKELGVCVFLSYSCSKGSPTKRWADECSTSVWVEPGRRNYFWRPPQKLLVSCLRGSGDLPKRRLWNGTMAAGCGELKVD